ncbi:SDR family NAD(P)-dependent oxidoreductase [Bosea caraganae]|uniref:SDR family NAD(P)-dependent oxidoreductase n=1 Tax=Bosea caraganae TaxID=2763117 RepID=A0A370L061_9HYPH|nr:SDR family oxidoreductase [Bosea caraganae]RDJ20650.1 SDR family NAD(P)-dependent oxidoreductase [Bosea caraganae]RDJ28927.1 SDR family NAD(P)-dependent oxidoreductase [Bosea caraganae]
MELGLSGKAAIVTGGAEGVGRAAAARLAREGANVLIVGRRQDVLAEAATALSQPTGGRVIAHAADITGASAPAEIVAAALSAFGRLDILVNNAGVALAKPFEAATRDDWNSDFNVKVWAAIELIRGAIPEMRRQGGGRIINVTSIDGRTPRASTMPTSVARAAGIAMTKGLSRDLAADNILVNTVCIGFIRSGQHERRFARTAPGNSDLDALYAEDAKRRGVPLGRVGEGEEAGDVIAFLASERASYLTGIAINIDGGTSAVV